VRLIYVEEAVREHPRTQAILAKYPTADVISCANYQAVFNRKGQNFRQQKELGPALILAEKRGRRVMAAPPGFGIGHQHNFYFSHLLNCPYDCRYCFLQGMYQSANLVLFVNFDDFMQDIRDTVAQHPAGSCIFFSGYDGDSLALDGLSGFLSAFLPFFRELSEATLELRSKSTQIRSLLAHEPLPNVVAAFSLMPDVVARKVEHKAPSIAKRLAAIKKLVTAGWQVGIRFDPLIQVQEFDAEYASLVRQLQAIIPVQQLHSVSVGALRFPVKMLDKLQRLYPKDRLLLYPFEQKKGVSSYPESLEQAMKAEVTQLVTQWVGADKLFSCEVA
jgi:spore photoproduct lyase